MNLARESVLRRLDYRNARAISATRSALCRRVTAFRADEAFLSRLRETDEDPVAFVIGGPGAGKTTSAEGALAEGNVVFDGSAVHAEKLIDKRLIPAGR